MGWMGWKGWKGWKDVRRMGALWNGLGAENHYFGAKKDFGPRPSTDLC